MASNLHALLDELQAQIDQLKILYEKYFMGIEKFEPRQERKEIAQIVRRIRESATTNTALRYRLNSLNQRFLSYQNYWNRIVREIENGTYHRDLARVERDMKRRGIEVSGLSKARSRGELEAALMQQLNAEAEAPSAEAAVAASSGGRAESSAGLGGPSGTGPPPIPGTVPARPPPIPAVAAQAAVSPAPGAEAGGAKGRLRSLYDAYVDAKKRTGESTDGLTYESLVRSLSKQVPAIKEKTGCRSVDFKSQIRNGRAVLKAVPRK